MKGMLLIITDPQRPGYEAAAFGYAWHTHDDGELEAWKNLAKRWNEGEFWHKEDE